MNIYVGNLPFTISEDEIRAAFAAFGQVASVAIIKDKITGRSRGFGFVEMSNAAEAQAAIQEMNGKQLSGRTLVVNQARPREERPDRGPGGYSDRRGPGGGGGGGRGGPRGGQNSGGRRNQDW
ncbi:MAG: RNA-binding protein [Chloroflexi bacterium]|nr:RNA-binding protein [Chloroflexota bacterium]